MNEIKFLKDAVIFRKPVLLGEGAIIITEDKKGFVIYKLSDLEEKIYYKTENLTPIVRINEFSVLMGNKIKIPVNPEKSEFYMEGRLLPETLIFALETHCKKKFVEGLLFIEFGKKMGKIYHSFNELQKDTTYISAHEDVWLNINSKEKYVLFKFRETKKMPELSMTPCNSTTPVYSRNVSGKGNYNCGKITKNLFGVKFESAMIDGEMTNVFEKEINTTKDGMIYENLNNECTPLMMETTMNYDEQFEAPPPPPPPLPPPLPPPSTGISGSKKKKMRNFHWSAIPLDKVEETFWGNKNDDSPLKTKVNVDESEIENLFSLSPTAPSTQKKKSSSTNTLTLVDFKRANNAGIILSRFSKDPWEIRNNLLNIDNESFSYEEIKTMVGLFPLTTKESFDIERFINKNKDQLDETLKTMNKVEQFYVLMSTVPRVESKIQSFAAFSVFKSHLEELKKNCGIIKSACTELKNSKQFKSILKIIFKVGSVLNRGSSLNAVGFRLNTLAILNETKAKNGLSLLHYITNLIYKQDPNLLLFQTGLPSVEFASKISIEALEEDFAALQGQISTFNLEYQSCCQEDSEISKKFVEKFSSFVTDAKNNLDEFSISFKEMVQSFVSISSYYGETELAQTKSSRGFFSILVRFASCLTKESDHIENKNHRIQRRLSLSTNVLKKKHKSRIQQQNNSNIFRTIDIENKENQSINNKKTNKKSALQKRMTIANIQNDLNEDENDENDELRSLLINEGAGIMEIN